MRVLGPAPDHSARGGGANGGGANGGSAVPPEASAAWHDRVSRELRFAQAVVLETLRLHPSVPKDIKAAVRDDVLPDGTVVRAGEFVVWLPCELQRGACAWVSSVPHSVK